MEVVANIVENFSLSAVDYPNPSDWAIEIYMCGCDFFCDNCSNNSLRDFNFQQNTHKYFLPNLISKVKEACRIHETNKLVLLGGDPLALVNRSFTKEFLQKMGINYDICVYTGYNYVDVKHLNLEGFKFLKCGTFCEDLQQLSMKTEDFIQFASTNQELYDEKLNLISLQGRYYFSKGVNN